MSLSRAVVPALVVAVLLALLPAQAAADTSRSVDGPGFLSGVVVDEARGRVLVSGGPDQRHVEAYDTAGQVVDRADGLSGAAAMVLSPDGSELYVLLGGAASIGVLDPGTLDERRRLAVPGDFQRGLALAGGRLWTTGSEGTVGVDVLTGALTPLPTTVGFVSEMASAPGGGVLAVAGGDTSPPVLATYDVSEPTPRLLAQERLFGNPWRELAVTPDDSRVLVAGSGPGVYVRRTSDLTALPDLGAATDRLSVSAEGRGLATAGDGTVELRDPATGSVVARSALDGFVISDGLAVGRGGTLAAAVVDRSALFARYDTAPFAVHVVSTSDARRTTTTGLPAAPARGAEPPSVVQLRGRLAATGAGGEVLPGRLLTVRRDGPGGPVVLERLVTGADGSFTAAPDSPRAPGSYRYSVDYAGDAQTAPTTGLVRHEVRRAVSSSVAVDALSGDLVEDGDRLLVSAPQAGEVRRLAPDGTVEARATGLSGVRALDLGDDVLLAVSPERPEVVSLDPRTLAVRARTPLGGAGCPDDVVAVGTRIAVHAQCGNGLGVQYVLVDPLVPALTSFVASPFRGTSLLDASGTRLAAVSEGRSTSEFGTLLFETAGGRLQQVARSPLGLGAIAFTGSVLYVGGRQRLDPQTLAPLELSARGVFRLALTPDGDTLLEANEGVTSVREVGASRLLATTRLGEISGVSLRSDRITALSSGSLLRVDLRPLARSGASASGPATVVAGSPAVVTGRLTGTDGAPLAGRNVQVGLGESGSLRLSDAVTVMTSDDGSYRAEVVPSVPGDGVWRVRYSGDQDAEPASAASGPVTVTHGGSAPAPQQPPANGGDGSPEPSPVPAPVPTPGGTPRDIADACPAEVPEDGFTDVPQDNPHERAVDCVVWWQVASGRSSTEYAPLLPVSRGQMASFVVRVIERGGGQLPQPTRDHFEDDDGTRHEDSINRLAEARIVGGRAPGAYAPDEVVRRDAMATFLVRAVQHRTGQLLPPASDQFVDDQGNPHEANIDKAAEAGLTGGTAPATYAPDRPVRRDQMGSFLARVLDLYVEEGFASTP